MPLMEAGSPAILLLAAGESRRFGGAKLLASFAGEPLIRRAARTALATEAPVIVVLGARAARIRPVIADLPLHLVENTRWQDGMGESIASGMRALRERLPHSACALIALADQPMVEARDLCRLIARHRQAPSSILACARQGHAGPPALFPRDCFDALAACRGPAGARAVLHAHRGRVELDDRIDPTDVDTPEALRAAECVWHMRQASC